MSDISGDNGLPFSAEKDWVVYGKNALFGRPLMAKQLSLMKEAYCAGWVIGHLRNQFEFEIAEKAKRELRG